MRQRPHKIIEYAQDISSSHHQIGTRRIESAPDFAFELSRCRVPGLVNFPNR